MITLPKMISAMGNDCVVATVVMACMYWRKHKQNLSWRLPMDFEDKEWNEFYKKGLTYVRSSGMPLNNTRLFLRRLSLPLNAKLELLEDAYGLRNLINQGIPPIVFYDYNYFMKHVNGLSHAVLLIDQTEELFVSIDPSLGPKFYHKLPKADFEEAWKLNRNATIITYPKTYRLEEKEIPSVTLLTYIGERRRVG